jgi:hypothetical protein
MPLVGANHGAAGRGRRGAPPGGLYQCEPAPRLTESHDHTDQLASADEHGQRPRCRSWPLRGELLYGQGRDGLGQPCLSADRLGRSTGRAFGGPGVDRQGWHSCGRRHRHDGSAAGYLGAIGSCLHQVRPQVAPRLAGVVADAQAGPSWSVLGVGRTTTDDRGHSAGRSEAVIQLIEGPSVACETDSTRGSGRGRSDPPSGRKARLGTRVHAADVSGPCGCSLVTPAWSVPRETADQWLFGRPCLLLLIIH